MLCVPTLTVHPTLIRHSWWLVQHSELRALSSVRSVSLLSLATLSAPVEMAWSLTRMQWAQEELISRTPPEMTPQSLWRSREAVRNVLMASTQANTPTQSIGDMVPSWSPVVSALGESPFLLLFCFSFLYITTLDAGLNRSKYTKNVYLN